MVQEPSDADFILSHGTEALGQQEGTEAQAMSLQEIKAMLQRCAEQGVPPPMVVANPDVVTVSGAELVPMPGTLAEYYASLGGKVHPSHDPATASAFACLSHTTAAFTTQPRHAVSSF